MKVHHLNCGCMCPIGGKYFPSLFPSHLICHCLLIESNEGLILIDTGFSTDFVSEKNKWKINKLLLGFEVDATVTAKNRIEELGFDIKDVRHVIPTHLDNDHAGAIYEFPHAKIHTSDLELDAALNPRTAHEFIRYRDFQLKNFKNWNVHNIHEGEDWFGFSSIKAISGLKDEILLIPLTGHTRGHFGVAVESEGKWLFHVGDSYYLRDELTDDSGLLYEPFLRSVHGKYRRVKENLTQIYQLAETHPEDVTVFSAHDPEELRRLQTS